MSWISAMLTVCVGVLICSSLSIIDFDNARDDVYTKTRQMRWAHVEHNRGRVAYFRGILKRVHQQLRTIVAVGLNVVHGIANCAGFDENARRSIRALNRVRIIHVFVYRYFYPYGGGQWRTSRPFPVAFSSVYLDHRRCRYTRCRVFDALLLHYQQGPEDHRFALMGEHVSVFADNRIPPTVPRARPEAMDRVSALCPDGGGNGTATGNGPRLRRHKSTRSLPSHDVFLSVAIENVIVPGRRSGRRVSKSFSIPVATS
jgi:hypothetical protein